VRSKVIVDGRQVVEAVKVTKLGFICKGIGHLWKARGMVAAAAFA
jgi:hypothetical protein